MRVMTDYTSAGIARRRSAPVRDAAYKRAQLDREDWSTHKPVFVLGMWRVYVSLKCQTGTAYADGGKHVIVTHPDTWRILSINTKTQAAFLNNMASGASGMKFLVMDSGPYGEAAKLAAKHTGLDVVMAKDLLTQVEEESQRLIVQASGLTGATQLQLQVFMARHAEVRAKLAQAELSLAKARSLVDLAADAIAAIQN